MAVLQSAALACLWALQHLALRGAPWPAVVTSSSRATRWRRSRPAAARSARRCSTGCSSRPACRSRAVAGLTAANLLVFAVVLAMPVLAVPAILRGGVSRGLLEAASSASWCSSRCS